MGDGSFLTDRVRLGEVWSRKIGRLLSIVAETTKKIPGEIFLRNQQRNFLTGLVTENVGAIGKSASNFITLHDQETIEWE